jgi:two-component sensor histidine kinase/PAS domain-containing protein
MTILDVHLQLLTKFSAAEVELLEKIHDRLELAGDISHAQVSLYVRVGRSKKVVLIGQAHSRNSLSLQRSGLEEVTFAAAEEPLVWKTLETGERIAGQREWALGMEPLFMETFPVKTAKGKIVAVLSFELSGEDTGADHQILLETVYMLLVSDFDLQRKSVYRPLFSQDGILVVNERGQIIYANAAAAGIYRVLGVGRLLGRRVHERALSFRLAQKAAITGQPQEMEVEVAGLVLSEKAVPVVQAGKTLRMLLFVADVTQLRKKEKELLVKSAVIQEIHHRVKNNLQTIASLLRLQARRSESPEVKAALRESVNRILSISLVHEFLSQQDEEVIDVAEVARNIYDLVIQSMIEPGFAIEKIFESEPVILPSERASSLALVVNELVQNAIEHGFIGRSSGIIGLRLSVASETAYRLEIYDNGIGLPAGFDRAKTKSLGIQIVRTLVETDLGGTFELFSSSGTHAMITIPRT